MKAKNEVSNKTLFGLIVAVTVISIVSTYFIVDSVMNAEPVVESIAEGSGVATLEIIEEPESGGGSGEATLNILESEESVEETDSE